MSADTGYGDTNVGEDLKRNRRGGNNSHCGVQ